MVPFVDLDGVTCFLSQVRFAGSGNGSVVVSIIRCVNCWWFTTREGRPSRELRIRDGYESPK